MKDTLEASTATGQLAWMRQQLARYHHRDGWTLTIDACDLPEGSPVLTIRYTAEDARNPGQQIRIISQCPFGPFPRYDEEEFRLELRRILLHRVCGHELDENLYRDGELACDPHADPTRWQCACGGLGPKREHFPQWTCPGCGRTQP